MKGLKRNYNSEKEKTTSLQIEARAKRNLDLLKRRQNLEITEAKEKYLKAVENRQNSQLDNCSVSNSILKDLTTNKIDILPASP